MNMNTTNDYEDRNSPIIFSIP